MPSKYLNDARTGELIQKIYTADRAVATECKSYTDTKIAAEVTRSDGAYLPLAGGTVTGNLSVSGSITGNVTGNASTATNATNDANGNPIASTYLPLAGGTMNGQIGVTDTIDGAGDLKPNFYAQSGAGGITFSGGNTLNYSGGKLTLIGVNADGHYTNVPTFKGSFVLSSTDGTNLYSLVGANDGKLLWNNASILTLATIGVVYYASWSASTSSANGTVLTNIMRNLPIGKYIVECKLPVISTSAFSMAIGGSNIKMQLSEGLGGVHDQNVSTRVVEVLNSVNTLYLVSQQSATCNFTYLDRGGIKATRLC